MLPRFPWSVLGGRTISGFCRARPLFQGPSTEAPRPLRHGRGSMPSPTVSTALSYRSLCPGVYGGEEPNLYFSGKGSPFNRRWRGLSSTGTAEDSCDKAAPKSRSWVAPYMIREWSVTMSDATKYGVLLPEPMRYERKNTSSQMRNDRGVIRTRTLAYGMTLIADSYLSITRNESGSPGISQAPKLERSSSSSSGSSLASWSS